jgi:glutamyl-Q tRNA(Asp) synthetase
MAPSRSSGRRPSRIASATARSVRTLAADSPTVRSTSSGAALRVSAWSGTTAAASRAQMALALATETCWAVIVAASPSKPVRPVRKLGRPPIRIMAARPSGSDRPSASSPASSAASLSRTGTGGRPGPAVLGITMVSAPTPITPAGGPATPVLRFAPSPNGYLHLGHAYSALMNRRVAQRLGGVLRLRFEDIDPVRCRPEYAQAALEDLAWLGIEFTPPILYQSGRLQAYREALQTLQRAGFVYPCFCTRGDISRAVAGRSDWPCDPDGAPLYPGTCRHLTAAERERRGRDGALMVQRLDMVAAFARCRPGLAWTEFREGVDPADVPAEPLRWGDAVLARKDVPTSYHLSVVVDDAAQSITDVVRGEDLFPATALHRLLQVLLGLQAPRYHHHRLRRDETGAKLSKTRQSASLHAMRLAGMSVQRVLAECSVA